MKISVALATANRPDFLEQQLNSLLNQTRQPDQIIVSDNQPSNETLNVIDLYKTKFRGNIEYIQNPYDVGCAKNFEIGLNYCSGNLIFLCDDDDIWFPQKIETMVEYFSNDPNIMVAFNNVEFYLQGQGPVGITKFEQYRSLKVDLDNFVMGCASCFRTELLELVLPFPKEEVAQDNWITTCANIVGDKAYHEQPLQYYRRHGANLSTIDENYVKKINLKFKIQRAFRLLTKTGTEQLSMRHKYLKLRMDSISERLDNLKNLTVRINNVKFKMDEIFKLEHRLLVREKTFFGRINFIIYGFKIGIYTLSRPKTALVDLVSPKMRSIK